MPLISDIIIDAAKFDPANNSEQANKLNEVLIGRANDGVDWTDVGAAKYRQMRWAGETNFPPPTIIPDGVNFSIPSRESGRDIPCRVMYPTSRKSEEERKACKGTVIHFHGGGWTLGDERSYDQLLKFYADAADLAVVSIGYRHAPEDPFPKGPEDCMDAGEYFVKHAEKEYGGPLVFIGGESAGAHLSMITIFHLLKVAPDFKLLGLLLHFGCYDMTELPMHSHMETAAIIPHKVSYAFRDAFLPGVSLEAKKHASISPYYEDLRPFRGRLPVALFTCGTEDPLLDDSVNMGTKWMMSGGEAFVKIYTGAPHGFIAFPPDALKESGLCYGDIRMFLEDVLARV